MSLWIKICGNTSLADAQIAVDAGADALGFVFAPSPRRVTPAQVAEITPNLSPTVEKIGVFVDTPIADILEAIHVAGLTGVQLHPAIATDVPSQLRQTLGPSLRILRVLHFSADITQQAANALDDPYMDALLVDSRTATAVGGTGIAFDWQQAREAFHATRRDGPAHIVVAGGLNPSNVADAIATLHPWGVDVVTGVEAAPGRKDQQKVWAFVANARRAHRA
ncbi:MAG TPA: phosphoribosylanthranilate isomerase [Terracidiphilus sp.]|nr:phosphoribosylanthranilate isomerase [Terracidiphilus sp.]